MTNFCFIHTQHRWQTFSADNLSFPIAYLILEALITELLANMDNSDVRLSEYDRSVSDLHSLIDTVTSEIHKKIEYYSTCDI